MRVYTLMHLKLMHVCEKTILYYSISSSLGTSILTTCPDRMEAEDTLMTCRNEPLLLCLCKPVDLQMAPLGAFVFNCQR